MGIWPQVFSFAFGLKKHPSADWKANAREEEPLSALAIPLSSSPCLAHAWSALVPVQIHVLL